MNAKDVDALSSTECRELALRWVVRTNLPWLRHPPRGSAPRAHEFDEDIREGRWPDGAITYPATVAALGRLHRALHEEILPRVDWPSGFRAGKEDIAVRVRRGYAERVNDVGAVRDASPFEFIPRHVIPYEPRDYSPEERERMALIDDARASRPHAVSAAELRRHRKNFLRDRMYSPDPVVAIAGLIVTLSEFPWARCENDSCGLVFAPRKGGMYCSGRCRGRAGYDRRRARLAERPREQTAARMRASESAKRIYHEKKAGTWKRQRRRGAGRPPKTKAE